MWLFAQYLSGYSEEKGSTDLVGARQPCQSTQGSDEVRPLLSVTEVSQVEEFFDAEKDQFVVFVEGLFTDGTRL